MRRLTEFRGDARLYRVEPPMVSVEYNAASNDFEPTDQFLVILSAVTVLGEPETYIFPANEAGEVVSWTEMPGSQKGTLSHDQVLVSLGYTVVEGEP
jgi:hypothetical protein